MQPLQEADKDSIYRCDGRGQGPNIHCVFLSMEGLVKEGSNPYEHDIDIVEGVKRCPKCGGKAQVEANRKKQLNTYRVATLNDDINHHLHNSKTKDLRNELAINRTLLERLLNEIGSSIKGAAMFAYVGQIERFLARTESLVKTIQQIETKSGEMMGPEEIIAFANKMTQVIMDCVPEDRQEEAALRIQQCLIN